MTNTVISSVVYVSKTQNQMSQNEINEIVIKSSLRNKLIDISGFLFQNDTYFLQYLEGHPSILKELMNRISNDSRHVIVNTSYRHDLTKRFYPSWQMKMLNHEISLEKTFLEYMIATSEGWDMNDENIKSNVWRMMDLIFDQINVLESLEYTN